MRFLINAWLYSLFLRIYAARIGIHDPTVQSQADTVTLQVGKSSTTFYERHANGLMTSVCVRRPMNVVQAVSEGDVVPGGSSKDAYSTTPEDPWSSVGMLDVPLFDPDPVAVQEPNPQEPKHQEPKPQEPNPAESERKTRSVTPNFF